MIIYPYLSLSPIHNGISIFSNNASIFAHKYKCSIKNIIRNIILNTICTIIWIFSKFTQRLCDWFSFFIKYLATLFKLYKLHPIRAKFIYQFFKSAHYFTSISAIILSISERRMFSLATISLICLLSSTISITSLLSSCSTYVETERL